jgi:hypothetical protein
MNKDLVIVESKTINNESISIPINIAEVKQGSVIDRREISRSYIFEDFQSIIPLKLAKILIKKYPDEYRIVAAVDENPSEAVKQALKRTKEDEKGYVCKICDHEAKSNAGLTSHMRTRHPDQFSRRKTRKVNKAKKESADNAPANEENEQTDKQE